MNSKAVILITSEASVRKFALIELDDYVTGCTSPFRAAGLTRTTIWKARSGVVGTCSVRDV
jgi:hypothetical protein